MTFLKLRARTFWARGRGRQGRFAARHSGAQPPGAGVGRGVSLRPVLSRLLARVGLVTPEQRAWARYDCGNSAYFTTVVTAVFPAFFASYAASRNAGRQATTRFGIITTMAMTIVALAAPVMGAYGDFTARRKQLLVACARVGVASTFLLMTITEGGWQWAAVVFILGNLGVSGSLVFYDSMLPSVAKAHETDRVSSAGYALGYLGGGVPAGPEPRVDPAAADVRAVGHGGGDQAVVCQRRRVVAALHDSAAAPRARAAARAGGIRTAAPKRRSARRSRGWPRPSPRSASTARRS